MDGLHHRHLAENWVKFDQRIMTGYCLSPPPSGKPAEELWKPSEAMGSGNRLNVQLRIGEGTGLFEISWTRGCVCIRFMRRTDGRAIGVGGGRGEVEPASKA